MNKSAFNEKQVESRIQNALGRAPAPDFDAWRSKHAQVLAELGASSHPSGELSKSLTIRGKKMKILRLVAATAALLLVGLFFWPGASVSPSAFAQDIPGIDQVQQMAWTVTAYIRFTSKDGQRSWIGKQREERAFRGTRTVSGNAIR